MSYEAMEKTMASFYSSLTELKEELARIESELAKAEATVGEAIRAQALGQGGNIKEAREKVQELKEKRKDVLDMINVVEKEKEKQLRKLFPGVLDHYESKVLSRMQKEAAEQVEAIKRAKAQYLYEIYKLKQLNDKHREEHDRFDSFRRVMGDTKHKYRTAPGIEYNRGWDHSFATGVTEAEIRRAFNGELHPEVKKYIEKIH